VISRHALVVGGLAVGGVVGATGLTYASQRQFCEKGRSWGWAFTTSLLGGTTLGPFMVSPALKRSPVIPTGNRSASALSGAMMATLGMAMIGPPIASITATLRSPKAVTDTAAGREIAKAPEVGVAPKPAKGEPTVDPRTRAIGDAIAKHFRAHDTQKVLLASAIAGNRSPADVASMLDAIDGRFDRDDSIVTAMTTLAFESKHSRAYVSKLVSSTSKMSEVEAGAVVVRGLTQPTTNVGPEVPVLKRATNGSP
jgi:hypothetical protein